MPLLSDGMSFPLTSTITSLTAVAGAVAAWGAWKAAQRSNTTAETVARIERERWHADLTPQFEISVSKLSELHIRLNVRLVGPAALGGLDEIAMSISNSDDEERRASPTTQPPTQEEIDAHVWGLYKFAYDVNGADQNGRTVDPFALDVGRGTVRRLKPNRYPYWSGGPDGDEKWRREYEGLPLRLVLTCRKEGHEPWFVPFTVDHSGV